MLIRPDKSLVWEDVPEPELKPGEALVEIYATALNRADLLQRQGTYPSPAGWPAWMGLELSGKILALGSEAEKKCKFRIGDNVCALVGGGAYAERIAVPCELLLPIPKGLSFEEAAAIPEAFATSYLNLFWEGGMKAGQTVYISAGASGLAGAAIPLAKAGGARVVTSVQTKTAAEKIRPLGADYIIIEEEESIPEAFRKLSENGTPVEIAMDCLAGEDLGHAMPYMAEGGKWIVISTLAGKQTNIELRPLLTKGLRLIGSMLRKRPNSEKERLLSELADFIWAKLEDGSVRPSIYKILPIEKAEEAHGILERFENTGKVVLRVRS